MNINLDDKRIKKIVYQLESGKTVEYRFNNGELVETLMVYNCSGEPNKDEKPLSDGEMIEAIKKSEFMDELNSARKRFKIDKEIVKDFPETDNTYRGEYKRSEDKCSEESLKVAQEIIKMDNDGKLDEIAATKRCVLDEKMKDIIKKENNELSQDSFLCLKSINAIEGKILNSLKNGNKEEIDKLIEDYNFYNNKKKKIDEKLWNETCEKIE